MGSTFWAYLWMGILNVSAISVFIYYKHKEKKENKSSKK